MRSLALFVLLLFCAPAFCQQVLPLGHWRTHLPYRLGNYVTQSPEAVFFSTGQAVIVRDKEEASLDFLTKVQGLSGTDIERIKYIPQSDILMVVYDNSVIDLVKPDRVSTLNQIRNFRNFIGNKDIHDIFVANDSIVYLAANYGLSKLNVLSERFAFTTFTDIDVQSIALYEGSLYASTEIGLYRVDETEPNPEVFSFWEWMGPGSGLPEDYSAGPLTVFNGTLYAGIEDSLVQLARSGEAATVIPATPGFELAYLSAEGDHLLAGYLCVSDDCEKGRLRYIDARGNVGEASPACMNDPRNAVEDQQGRIWFGDGWSGLKHLAGLGAENCNTELYNSPWSQEVYEITVQDKQVWLASGGVDVRFSYRFLDHGFASLIDGQWRVYNRFTESGLQGNDPDSPPLDFLSVEVDPASGKIYAGAYFEGLIEIDNGNFTLYDDSNSSLGNAVGDAARTRVSDIEFDAEGNLWVANFLAEAPLSTLSPEGNWRAYRPACGQTQIHKIGIDQEDYKWVVVANTQSGILLYDEGDPEDPSDDRCRNITNANSNLPTNRVNTLEVDLDGDVWVGTGEGVVIFECGQNAFEEDCIGSLRIVEQDGFNAYLLATEDVQAIGVDGANRKWVGTLNGLFLISANGREQLAHFTTANSPLLSNVITDVEVDPATGEVFIGTDAGLISYQGDAVEGGPVHADPIQVFPNPVRPEYRGPIAIRGLARDANVKITDVNGKLVYETTALGGQAVWDGRDYTGRRANSGVYLVFSTSDPGETLFASKPDGAVARIVLIRGEGE